MNIKRMALLIGVVLAVVLVILVNGYRSGPMRGRAIVDETVAPEGTTVSSVLSLPNEEQQARKDASALQDPDETAEEQAQIQELIDKLQKQAAYLADLKNSPPDDPELEKDAKEFMFAEVEDLLNKVPFYGLDSIPSNSVAKGRLRFDGSRTYGLETPDLTTFAAEGTSASNMIISKAVVRSAHPEGLREMRFPAEQRDAIKRMQYVAVEAYIPDEAIKQVFNAAALEAGISERQLGISDEHPGGVAVVERTKVIPAKSIQQYGKPVPPENTVDPDTDAYIKVTLHKPDDPECRLFELEFRTVQVGEDLYQPQVVRWICNAFD